MTQDDACSTSTSAVEVGIQPSPGTETVMEVLATLSHELRSPLTAIQGYTSTLLRHAERLSEDERREFLLAIHGASNRLETIISRLLEISQLRLGTLTLVYSTVNVLSLLREVIAAHMTADGTHPLILATQLQNDESVDWLISADHHRLREVLELLIENARMYSLPGEPIELGAQHLSQYEHAESAGQQAIELWVRDRGVGIPAQQLEAIFQQFHRLDMSMTREVSGLGLGLSICQYLVALHGGTIRVESEERNGSTFYIQLPVGERVS